MEAGWAEEGQIERGGAECPNSGTSERTHESPAIDLSTHTSPVFLHPSRHSANRYCSASATWSPATSSTPPRSAIVRATLSTRS